MSDQLLRVLKKKTQRTSSSTNKLKTDDERASFANNVKADLAGIYEQLNQVHYPLLASLASESSVNALETGLCGNVIKTNIFANSGSSKVYWDSSSSKVKTIKESLDTLLAEIARLETVIARSNSTQGYNDSALQSEITDIGLHLQQLLIDTMGSDYVLDSDGLPNRNYSLSQAVDAIGNFFTGFPALGTYDTTFPALSLQVLLSQISLDTTIPVSTITDLSSHLDSIKTFTGQDLWSDSTPDYSAHGANVSLSNGDSLELALHKLDAIIPILPTYTSSAVLFGQGSKIPVVDAVNFNWDNVNKRLGVGTNTPEAPLDIRGVIQHAGVISRGGNARGTNAIDLQTVRTNASEVASGTRSSILGGEDNTASGTDSVAGGKGSTANAANSLAIGNGVKAQGDSSSAFGKSTQANGAGSQAMGSGSKTDFINSHAQGSGMFADIGDAQVVNLVVRNQTTGVGPFYLYLNGVTATEQIVLADHTAYAVYADVIYKDGSGNINHYVLEGTVQRIAGAGTVALVGGVTQRIIVEQAAAADATLAVDTATGSLRVQVTGVALTVARWVAHVKLTNVHYEV